MKEILFNPNKVKRGVWHINNFKDMNFVDTFKKPNFPFYYIQRDKLVALKKKEHVFHQKSERV
jgi:hypothetical protein